MKENTHSVLRWGMTQFTEEVDTDSRWLEVWWEKKAIVITV